MKDTIDFIKINGGKYGAINLNNMLPAIKEAVIEVDFKVLKNKDFKLYNIILNQIDFININSNTLI
ncbi:MAG: type III toxin-antitoxin system ToxN/AbiQ family toxin [Fusobacteriaceae bacterium]|jgi:protein AbiQ|nr:type III toxin-antitoxin system ToxN/AbiQ family toxin [Fusobacteriaceae bacterium]